MDTKRILDSVFEGHDLTTIIIDDRLMWKASEISMALGYTAPYKVSNLIKQNWKEEFIEGEDFVITNNTELDVCYTSSKSEGPSYGPPKFEGPSYGPSKSEKPSYGFSNPPKFGTTSYVVPKSETTSYVVSNPPKPENTSYVFPKSENPSYGFSNSESPSYGLSKNSSGNLRRCALLLTEQGVDLVILKTRKPAGKRLRRHLSSVVLPQLRREMIKERPISELEAQYQRELLNARAETIEASKEARKYAAMLIDTQSAWAPAVSSMKKQATQAGRLLRDQKGTKKLRDLN